jgi:hypothetical protein
VGRFITDPGDTQEVAAELYGQFRSERPAFFSLNADLLGMTIFRRKRFDEMRSFAGPVRITFGPADPYLNAGVAKRFHRLFPTSDLSSSRRRATTRSSTPPAEVARLILSVPTSESLQVPDGNHYDGPGRTN